MTADSTGAPQSGRTIQSLPPLGLGTWQNDDSDQCSESVKQALELGYRHIDTAQIYRNEAAVGAGIEQAAVDREDIVLATKVWNDNLAHDDVISSTEESLDRLGVAYVDLLYVHWPVDSFDPETTLSAFAELQERGLIKHVGLSNFTPELLDAVQETAPVEIDAVQVECHPLLQQDALREYCARHDIELVAYSPLARGDVFDIPELTNIADAHGVSEAQVSLAWLDAHDVCSIPKATGRDHIVDNFAATSLSLTQEQVATIDAIDHEKRLVDPSFAPSSW